MYNVGRTGAEETGERSTQSVKGRDLSGKQRSRIKKKELVKPLELWEIQQTLGRGEFVEVLHGHLVSHHELFSRVFCALVGSRL